MLKQPLLPSRDRGVDGDTRSINGSSTGRVAVVVSSSTSSAASNGKTSSDGAAAAPPPSAVSQKSLLLSNKAQQPVSPQQSAPQRTAELTVSLTPRPHSASLVCSCTSSRRIRRGCRRRCRRWTDRRLVAQRAPPHASCLPLQLRHPQPPSLPPPLPRFLTPPHLLRPGGSSPAPALSLPV
jgi:hypothetical protein